MMNVVVVDHYPIPRRGIADLVRLSAPEATIVELGSATDAIEYIRSHPVDLVLCDRSTGAMWHAEWLAKFVTASRSGKVVVLSQSIDLVSYQHDLAAGANGCITMTSSVEVASAAIRLIIAGGQYFPAVLPGVAQSCLKGPDWGTGTLSPRQLQVVMEIENGLSNKEIASRFGISVATVKLHVQAILKATGAKNRTGAVNRFRKDVLTQ